MTTERIATTTPLDVLRRTRDLAVGALTTTTMPTIEELTAVQELSDECQLRGGGSEPDALDRLLFLLRRRQAAIERRIAAVRRRHGR